MSITCPVCQKPYIEELKEEDITSSKTFQCESCKATFSLNTKKMDEAKIQQALETREKMQIIKAIRDVAGCDIAKAKAVGNAVTKYIRENTMSTNIGCSHVWIEYKGNTVPTVYNTYKGMVVSHSPGAILTQDLTEDLKDLNTEDFESLQEFLNIHGLELELSSGKAHFKLIRIDAKSY